MAGFMENYFLQNHYRERQKIKSMLEQVLAMSDTKF
jgi:hypothetical protein